MPARSLLSQVAVVTGGGRGVGRAVAERLGAAGAAVAVAARSRSEIDAAAQAIRDRGGRAVALAADVTDEQSVEALVSTVEDALGPPTLLVNAAGSWRHVGPVADADPRVWWGDVEVNLKGTFLCTRAVLPAMLGRRAGRIVNVASYAATGPRPFATAYAASKAAVLRFSDSLAAEVAGRGVSVFAVTPGFVRTRLVDEIAASEEGRRYLPELAAREDALEPERLGELVLSIASGRLDSLSGAFLHVLDDVDELLRRADEVRAQGLHTLRLRT
ncbi:MAG TPA: SDR family oxidoreductase [Gaiellaceae bacterium]|nr:SDR family oxidoreductase [Gaiellaceae bacterium]